MGNAGFAEAPLPQMPGENRRVDERRGIRCGEIVGVAGCREAGGDAPTLRELELDENRAVFGPEDVHERVRATEEATGRRQVWPPRGAQTRFGGRQLDSIADVHDPG